MLHGPTHIKEPDNIIYNQQLSYFRNLNFPNYSS